MRVLVIARTVPDSRATIRVNASGGAIETTGVAMICDPFDELGVEQGVRLREGRPDVTEAVVMSAGPGPATPQDQALRAALAMGIDRGIYVHGDLVTPPARYDELLLARVLAAAIKAEEAKNGEFALILCGKAAIDTDAGELGPALGELLNRPSIGAATKIEIGADAKSLKATRRGDGVSEAIEASLPAVVSCEKGLAEPRFASLPNIMILAQMRFALVDRGKNFDTGDELVLGHVTDFDRNQAHLGQRNGQGGGQDCLRFENGCSPDGSWGRRAGLFDLQNLNIGVHHPNFGGKGDIFDHPNFQPGHVIRLDLRR